MNKDLDERLVPNGEYRDALNIQVSTSEGSDVGSAQNLLSNAQLIDWTVLQNTTYFNPSPFNSSQFSEPLIMDYNSAKAEAVGFYADDNRNKVYVLVADANGTYQDTNPSSTFYNENAVTNIPSNGLYSMSTGQNFVYQGLYRELGIRADVIYEKDFGSLINQAEPILVDVFEARHAPRAILDVNNNNNVIMPMTTGNLNEIRGLATVTTNTAQGNTVHLPAGIREGMVVKKIRPDGLNLWANFPDVVVKNIPTNGALNNGVIEISRLADGQSIYDQSDMDNGTVLVFQAPRVLNFQKSVTEIEQDPDTLVLGSTSPTPNKNLITAINIVDDILFFTDGRNEPKKINIERFKTASLGLLDHTHVIFPSGDQQFGTAVREEHITAAKINPKKAPEIKIFGVREQDASASGYADLTTTVVRKVIGSISGASTLLSDFALDDGTANSEFTPGSTIIVKTSDTNVYWLIDDTIEINLGGNTARFKIIDDYSSNANNPNGNHFKLKFLEFVSSYVAPQTTGSWVASLVTKKGLYKDQFVKFALRYKYLDGEYSCISPYSRPAFRAGGYSLNALLGENDGMQNKLDSFLLYDFVSSDIPEDVEEIQILYRETDGYPAVYTAYTVKVNSTHWNAQYPVTNANKIDKGAITVDSQIFGNIIPTNQLDRSYDALPKKAKAQEFVSSRLMYGNYTENYDLIDSSGNNINGNLSLYTEFFEFPALQTDYSELSVGGQIINIKITDDYGFPRHGINQIGGISNLPANGNVNYSGGDNRPFDHTDNLNWGQVNTAAPGWFNDTSVGNSLMNGVFIETDFNFSNYNASGGTGLGAGSISNDAFNTVTETGQSGNTIANGIISAPNLPKLTKIPFDREVADPNSDFNIDTSARPNYQFRAPATGQYTFSLSCLWKSCYTHGYVLGPSATSIKDLEEAPALTVSWDFITAEQEKFYNPWFIPVFRPSPAAIQLHFVNSDGQPTIPSTRQTSLVPTVSGGIQAGGNNFISGEYASTDPTNVKLIGAPGTTDAGLELSEDLDEIINGGDHQGVSFNFYKSANNYNIGGFINSVNNEIYNRWRNFNSLDLTEKLAPIFINCAGFATDNLTGWSHTGFGNASYLSSSTSTSSNISVANMQAISNSTSNPSVNFEPDMGNNLTDGEIAHYASDKFLYTPRHYFDDHADAFPYSYAEMEVTVDLLEGEEVSLFYRAWDFEADGINSYDFLDKHPHDSGGLFRQYVPSDTDLWATQVQAQDAWPTIGGVPHFAYTCDYNENVTYYGAPQTQQVGAGPSSNNSESDPIGLVTGLGGFNPIVMERLIDYSTGVGSAGYDMKVSFGGIGQTNYFGSDYASHGVAGGSYYLNIKDEINGFGAKRTNFRVLAAPAYSEDVIIKKGTESIKSERVYELGVVYLDKFGRESTVIIDQDGDYSSSKILQKDQSKTKNRFETRIYHNAPAWAESYKFFIKEVAPEYYNISLHKAYDNNDGGVYAWLSFNSSDTDKIKVGDYISQKKKHGSNDSVNSLEATWKVLAKNEGIPNGADGNPIDAAGSTFSNGAPTIPIGGQDSGGKFFIKIEADDAFDQNLGNVNLQGGPLQSDNNVVNGAVFEVIPDYKTLEKTKENEDELGFFWEMTDAIPIKLDKKNAQQFIKIGHIFEIDSDQSEDYGYFANVGDFYNNNGGKSAITNVVGASIFTAGLGSSAWSHVPNQGSNNTGLPIISNDAFCELTLENPNLPSFNLALASSGYKLIGKITNPEDGSYVSVEIGNDIQAGSNRVYVKPYTHSTNGYSSTFRQAHDWFNCYSFGNGVESDRIRDDFNEKTLFAYTAIGKQSGFKASKFFDDYKEEYRPYDIIFSQLYNERAGIDQTNQFILADTITKRLNPEYGAITKLHARNAIGSMDDVIALCENKIVKILSGGKDALFNADGNPQLLTSSRVLGQTMPFGADLGCQNPESFAADQYRVYFTDVSKGSVCRLSRDGITSISDVGMSDWFYDNLSSAGYYASGNTLSVIGSFDDNKQEYNITLHNSLNYNFKKNVYSLAYHEPTDGWVSFRSYVPEFGFSINNRYYTIKNGVIWGHNEESSITEYNKFYGTDYDSTVTLLFNDAPSSVKSFRTVSYEGTQAKIVKNLTDGEYYNNYNSDIDGWFVDDITTDKQEGSVPEFIEKEGKWFNYIHGQATTYINAADGSSIDNNIDFAEFNMQGLGNLSADAVTVDGTNPSLGNNISLLISSPTNVQGITVDQVLSNSLTNISTTPSSSFTSAFEIIPSPGYSISAGSFLADLNNSTITNSSGVAVNPFNSNQSITFSDTTVPNTPANTVLATVTFDNAVNINSDQSLSIPLSGIAVGGSLIYEANIYINHSNFPSIPTFSWSPGSGLVITPLSSGVNNSIFKIYGLVNPSQSTNLFSFTASLVGQVIFAQAPTINYANIINTSFNYSSSVNFNSSAPQTASATVDYLTSVNDETFVSADNQIYIDLNFQNCSITPATTLVILDDDNNTDINPI